VIAGADALAEGTQVRVTRDLNPYTGLPTAVTPKRPQAEVDSPSASKQN
jgi:hypothetical protein